MEQFNFWSEINISKSNKDLPKDDSRYDNMTFSGIASDSSPDFEEETMEPNGFEIDGFLKHGYFNLDHLTTRATENKSRYWIGEPISGEIKNNKFFLKGKLWKKSPEARAFWDKCIEMRDSGSNRKPGMSIEGQVLERDKNNPKKILKAKIINVALTLNPVNPNTWLDITKGTQVKDWVDYDFGADKGFDDKVIILDYIKDGYRITVDRDFRMKISPIKQNKPDNVIFKAFKDKAISNRIFDAYCEKLRK